MQCKNMKQHAAICILLKLSMLRSCAISAGFGAHYEAGGAHVLVINAVKESIRYSGRGSSTYSIAETVLKFMQSKRCINGSDGISAFLAINERLVLAVSITVTASI